MYSCQNVAYAIYRDLSKVKATHVDLTPALIVQTLGQGLTSNLGRLKARGYQT